MQDYRVSLKEKSQRIGSHFVLLWCFNYPTLTASEINTKKNLSFLKKGNQNYGKVACEGVLFK